MRANVIVRTRAFDDNGCYTLYSTLCSAEMEFNSFQALEAGIGCYTPLPLDEIRINGGDSRLTRGNFSTQLSFLQAMQASARSTPFCLTALCSMPRERALRARVKLAIGARSEVFNAEFRTFADLLDSIRDNTRVRATVDSIRVNGHPEALLTADNFKLLWPFLQLMQSRPDPLGLYLFLDVVCTQIAPASEALRELHARLCELETRGR